MSLGGVAFEDRRIPVSDWPSVRDETPFRAVPVLEVDDKMITQSNAINRYVGKLAGLYPDDDLDPLLPPFG
jgi:glutathione S-transferase